MAVDTSGREPLLDLPAVAERLGVNERHVRRLVAERRIPFSKAAVLVPSWGRRLRRSRSRCCT
jgi:hypothetical protein